MFTTGGYSAEYGQALSSTLSLNSIGLPDETESNLSLMTVGGDFSHSQLWEKSSLFAQVGYTNLNPYIGLVDQAYDFDRGYTAVDGIVSFRQKTANDGMLKVFANFNSAGFEVNQFNINDPQSPDHTDLRNDYGFFNATYQSLPGKKWSQRSGFSFTRSKQDLIFNSNDIEDALNGFHIKSVWENDHSERLTLRMGAEVYQNKIEQQVNGLNSSIESDFTDYLMSSFVEGDVYLSPKLVLRPGLRSEFSTLTANTNLAPRASLAYKTSDHGQVSAAYGQYFQSPSNERFLVSDELDFEKATHYILNYQVIKGDRVFRIEGYHKDYDNLVKYDRERPFDPASYDQNGNGHASGVDLFWRDAETFKNVDYWISYSFLDTKRNFRDYPQEAVPDFASRHNLSVVYKHFITRLRTQFGVTYSFTGGRPFHDPNMEGFNQREVPAYHDLSFNAAYLFRQNVIFYTSITNLPGRDNIFGYQYASSPNEQGQFERFEIGQPAKRFYFLGVFITFSKDKNKNQLNNL